MGHTATPEAHSSGLTATEHRLANGLRVVLSEDHLTPVAAVCLWYDVGSRHEVKGRSWGSSALHYYQLRPRACSPKSRTRDGTAASNRIIDG